MNDSVEPSLYNLVDLHAHLTPSLSPAVFWHIAHTEGYILPKRDYHAFADYITLSLDHTMELPEYLDSIYHPILNKLASGSRSLAKAAYAGFGGAYRSGGISLLEIRCNPMKYNHDGAADLDHTILAILRGMEQALLEYPYLKGGVIFCLDRQYPYEKNVIIVEKAIKYYRRGVIGIDFANYNKGGFTFRDYDDLVKKVRQAGLGVTAHTGERDVENDMDECIASIRPNRIGHGIKAAYSSDIMRELVKQNVLLEVCPMSNLVTRAVKDIEELRFIFNTLWDNGVRFSINTDWPETVRGGKLKQQIAFLLEHRILAQEQIDQTIVWAKEATFIPLNRMHETNLYL